MAIRPFVFDIEGIQFLGGLFYGGPAGQEDDIFPPLMAHVSEKVEQWLLSLTTEARKQLADCLSAGYGNNELRATLETLCQEAIASGYAAIGRESGYWNCCLASVYYH